MLVISTVKKNKAGKGNGECQLRGLDWVVRVGLTEEVTFGKRAEWGEGACPVSVLGKKPKAEGGISAKVLRQERVWGGSGMERPSGWLSVHKGWEVSRGGICLVCPGLCWFVLVALAQ